MKGIILGIVEDLLSDKGSELTSGLVEKEGFSAEQAQSFLPPAIGNLADLIKGGGLDLGSLLGTGGAAEGHFEARHREPGLESWTQRVARKGWARARSSRL